MPLRIRRPSPACVFAMLFVAALRPFAALRQLRDSRIAAARSICYHGAKVKRRGIS